MLWKKRCNGERSLSGTIRLETDCFVTGIWEKSGICPIQRSQKPDRLRQGLHGRSKKVELFQAEMVTASDSFCLFATIAAIKVLPTCASRMLPSYPNSANRAVAGQDLLMHLLMHLHVNLYDESNV